MPLDLFKWNMNRFQQRWIWIQARGAAAPKVWPDGKPDANEDAAAHGAGVGFDEDADDSDNLTGKITFARGDVESGMAQSAVIVEKTYTTQGIHTKHILKHNLSLFNRIQCLAA